MSEQPTLTKDDLVRDLARLDAARGVIVAALQTPAPTPDVLAQARKRAAGHVRVLVAGEGEKRLQ